MQHMWIGIGLMLTGLVWLSEDRFGMGWLAPLILMLTGVAVLVERRKAAASA